MWYVGEAANQTITQIIIECPLLEGYEGEAQEAIWAKMEHLT